MRSTVWMSLVMVALLASWLAWVPAVGASESQPGPASPGASADADADDGRPPAFDITLLSTVNLPWQDPEVIITARENLRDVEVRVRSNGRDLRAHWPVLKVGQARSLLWTTPVGSHHAQVTVRAQAASGPTEREYRGEYVVRQPLQVSFGPEDVDLEQRRLRVAANAPIRFVELSLYGTGGRELHHAQHVLDEPATAAALTWPAQAAAVAHITLRVFASDDTWAEASYRPIQIELAPPALVFDDRGDQAVRDQGDQGDQGDQPVRLLPADREKLDALAARVRQARHAHAGVRGLKLYVLGTSDDAAAKAGAAARAEAAARYVKRRVPLPVVTGAIVDPGFAGIEYIVARRAPAPTRFQRVR